MFGRFVKWGHRLFPERQILIRAEGRVSYVTLSRRVQVALLGVGLTGIAGLGYGAITVTAIRHTLPPNVAAPAPDPSLQARVDQLQKELADAHAKLAQTVAASAASSPASPSTADAIAQAQTQIKTLEDARDRAIAQQKQLQSELAAAQEAANAKAQNLAQLNHTLDANRGELKQSDAQRLGLQNRVRQLETELDNANSRTIQYKSNLESIERQLQQLAAEHNKTVAERDRLQAQLSALQGRNTLSPSTSGADAAAAPAVPPRAVADRPSDQHSENTHSENAAGDLEQLIASTGIDVEKVLSRLGSVPAGQGGPYVALNKKNLAASSGRSEELQKIVKTLPLAEPLAHFQIGSGFGARSDPFNSRQAFHPGLDLEAPYRSPVFSTGPGVVIFAGVKGDYGKAVEIDHGHGIVTRYAHLHRILVARGQKVAAHQEVGELGSTGRATGPHLHYEVLVDGTAQDPEKFMQAGKNVVQTSGR